MSALLTETQFANARAATRAGSITPELYQWLRDLVALAQATRTLAPPPVPGGRWDDVDAVSETVQAWLESSLLRGGLLQAFDTCESPRGLSRYLERALRNWLIDQSRRRTGPRLLERAVELLGDAPFSTVVDSPSARDRWWGLADWETAELFAGTDDEVASAAWALGDLAILRFGSSERADPVLSTPDLARYLQGVLEQVGAPLSGRHFDYSFRHRFSFAYATATEALEEAAEPFTTSTPERDVLIADSAVIALGALTERQLLTLIGRPTKTLEELAAQLQTSRGTVDNEYRRALIKVKDACSSNDEFREVLETAIEMASR